MWFIVNNSFCKSQFNETFEKFLEIQNISLELYKDRENVKS